jgi:hypothetical protein
MIPALRNTFGTAADHVKNAIVELTRGGYLSAAWLGDETSSAVANHYKLQAMDGPDSSHNALVSYHAELRRIHDTLHQMEVDYLRKENQTADTFRLQA